MALRNVLSHLESTEARSINLSNQYGQDQLRFEEGERKRKLDSISQFSKTLSEHLVREKEAENLRLYDEGRIAQIEEAIEMEEQEEGSSVLPEEREQHDQGVDHLKQNKTAFDTAALNIAEQGGSFQESDKVKNMSGWKLYGHTVQKAVSAGQNYEGWIEGEMANNDDIQISFQGKDFTPKTAETLDEKKVAMVALRRKYLQEQGLLGVHKVLLADHFYKHALPAHNKVMANFQKQDAIEKSFIEEENLVREFAATKDFGSLISGLASLKDENNKTYRRRGALKKAFEIVQGQADINEFDADDYEDLGNQQVMVDGKLRRVKDYWKTRYEKLGEDLIEEEKENLALSETAKENKFKEDEGKKIEELKNAPPEELTPRRLLDVKEKLESDHIGYRSTKLDNFINNASPDAKTLARQKLEVEKLLKYGLLTEEKLLEFDLRLYKEYAGVAKVISKGKDKTEKYLGYVEDMVEFSGKLLPGGQSHPSVAQMTDIFKMKYRRYYADAIAAGSETPEVDAWNAVEQEFGDGTSWKYAEGVRAGQYKIHYQTTKEGTIKTQKAIDAELDRQDKLFEKHGKGAIGIPEAFISKTALEENLKTFGTPGWTPPGVVSRLKKRFPEKDDLEILQALGDANGVKINLPTSPALDVIKKNTTTEEKAVLNQGSANGTARVFASVATNKGSDNVELVPNGEGPNVAKAATDSGLSFGEAAGAYEFLLANNDAAFKLGVTKEDLGLGGTGIKWDRLGQAIRRLVTSIDSTSLDTTDVMTQRLRESVANNEEGITEGITQALEALQTTDTTDVLASQTRQITSDENLRYLAEVLTDATGQPTDTTEMISGQLTEALNELVNQVLEPELPLTAEDKQDLAIRSWKYSGDPLFLNKTLRINNGQG